MCKEKVSSTANPRGEEGEKKIPSYPPHLKGTYLKRRKKRGGLTYSV